MKKTFVRILAITVAITALVAFQNCDRFRLNKGIKKTELFSGNGESYDGLRFASFGDRTCSDGTPSSLIELKGADTAVLTRVNCEDIEPQTMSTAEIHFMPHNISNVVFSDRIYDPLPNSDQATYLLCRGVKPLDSDSQVSDVLMRMLPNGDFVGRLKLGIYDLNKNLVRSYDTGESSVTEPYYPGKSPTGPYVVYSGFSDDHQQSFSIKVDKPTGSAPQQLHGELSYTPDGSPVTNHNDMNLDCWMK